MLCNWFVISGSRLFSVIRLISNFCGVMIGSWCRFLWCMVESRFLIEFFFSVVIRLGVIMFLIVRMVGFSFWVIMVVMMLWLVSMFMVMWLVLVLFIMIRLFMCFFCMRLVVLISGMLCLVMVMIWL